MTKIKSVGVRLKASKEKRKKKQEKGTIFIDGPSSTSLGKQCFD